MLPCAPNSNCIAQVVDDAVRFSRINRNSLCLLLSDTAKYIVAADAILQWLFSKLFHVTNVAHLFHNGAMKVKSHCEDIDQRIAKVKSATVKNKTRQAKFVTIGYPPQPAVTRWRSSVNASLDYVKNAPDVKAIVEGVEGSAILVTQAQVSLQTTGLATLAYLSKRKACDSYKVVWHSNQR